MRSTTRLMELIGGKHQVLLSLRELGRRQAELVASGDLTSLLKLLAVKQQVISGLQDLERELAPYYAEEPERRVWQSPDQRARCARESDACNELLREVLSLEKSSAERMSTRRNEVAAQLEQVHATNQVRNAYEAYK